MQILEKLKSLAPIPMKHYEESFVSNNLDERIQIQYYFDAATGHFYAEVLFAGLAQGPPGHVHGGAIASVLDEAMGGAAWLNKFYVMTGQLTVSFKRPLPLAERVFAESWVEKVEQRRVIVKSHLISDEGVVYSSAEGIFVRLPLEKFKEMGGNVDKLFIVS